MVQRWSGGGGGSGGAGAGGVNVAPNGGPGTQLFNGGIYAGGGGGGYGLNTPGGSGQAGGGSPNAGPGAPNSGSGGGAVGSSLDGGGGGGAGGVIEKLNQSLEYNKLYVIEVGGGGGGTAGPGGSGIVVIRYPNTYAKATVTGDPIFEDRDGYYWYTFTGSGTISFN
jgi:hypothetical protein